MTDDIKNYRFDFEREVKALQQYLGAKADKIIFADIGTDPRNRDPGKRAFLRRVIGDERLQELAKDGLDEERESYAQNPYRGPDTSPIVPPDLLNLPVSEFNRIVKAYNKGKRDKRIPGMIVSINSKNFQRNLLGKKFDEIDMLNSLYHETAHALIAAPGPDDDHPQAESIADAYAALRLLQRFGQSAVPYLNLISWKRSNDAMKYNVTNHLTSTVLDKIIFDSQREDFSKLTVDATIKRAKTYAKQWTPDVLALRAAKKTTWILGGKSITSPLGKDPVDWLMSTTSLSGYTPGNLGFYVAARSAMPALYPGMRVRGAPAPDPKEIERAQRLADHAATMGFSVLFNGKAAAAPTATAPPTIAEMISPAPPASREIYFQATGHEKMTEDINSYSFDFKKEAEALRQSLGQTADVLCFMEVDAPWPDDGKDLPPVTVPQIIAGKRWPDEVVDYYKDMMIDHYTDEPYCGSVSLPLAGNHDLTSFYAIFIRKSDPGDQIFGAGNQPLMLLHNLYHEAGHALFDLGKPCEDGEEDKPESERHRDKTLGESAADAYAALCLLQRFGDGAKPFISMMSWYRSHSFMTGDDTTHLTSTVVDKILFDSQNEDFSRLSPEQIRDKAATYAEKWTPEAAALQKAMSSLRSIQYGLISRPAAWLMSTTSLSGYTPDNLAFYVAAKSAMPALHPEMRTDWTGNSGPLDVARATLLAGHAEKMGFACLFDNAAAAAAAPASLPTIAEMISPPRLSSGQKQFIYNPSKLTF